MDKISVSIKQNIIFFGSYALLTFAGIIFLLVAGKTESFIAFNHFHFHWADFFLSYYTLVGDGLFAIFLAAIYFFLFKKKQLGLTIFCAFLSSGILAQIVKHIYNSPRPKFYFGNTEDQYFIKGIDFAFNNSFPSGHTATAFAVATVLVLNLQNKKLQLPLLFAALLVAFSRIYLGQHFLLDVLVGAFIGVVCGIGCVYFFWKSKKAK